MKIHKIWLILPAATMLLLPGCGKKDPEPEASGVMQLTITPRPSPTPVPNKAFPDATATKDGVTFVNRYLLDRDSGKPVPSNKNRTAAAGSGSEGSAQSTADGTDSGDADASASEESDAYAGGYDEEEQQW